MFDKPISQCVVAIVDDERSVRKGLSNLLKSAGYTTLCFESGEAFLEFDRLAGIDFLVLDIKLDGMDGFEVQRRLVMAGTNIPVIFVSAFGDELTRKRAMGSGAIAFLPKPIDVDVLLSDIHATLVSRRSIR